MRVPRNRLAVTEAQNRAISRAFLKKNISSGREIGELEAVLKSIFEKKQCFLTVNGFSAIYLALAALGLKNSKVMLPAVSTCFSIFHAIRASGNIPVFSDVNDNDFNLSCSSAVQLNQHEDIAAIISPNHMGIQSDIEGLRVMNVPLIEDCAQSFLTNAGVKSLADFQVFSFYPTKMINGIDGGALLTSDVLMGQRVADIGAYTHQTSADNHVRYNFRMPNIHAALCLVDVARWMEKRARMNSIVSAYDAVLGMFEGVGRAGSDSTDKNCLYKYIIVFDSPEMMSLAEGKLQDYGIECTREFLALWAGDKESCYPNASRLIASSFAIPFFEDITDAEVLYICTQLERVLKEVVRAGA